MAGSVFLNLNRPQYVSVPEAFLTALAASAFEVEYSGIADDPKGRKLAVAYEFKRPVRNSSTLHHHWTRPDEHAQLDAFGAALEDAGLECAVDRRQFAGAISAAIAGVQPRDGRVRATIPMTSSLALAQNLRGLAGVGNPPNVAVILEQLFQMGAPAGKDDEPGAAMLWVQAARRRSHRDPVAKAIDSALGATIFESGPTPLAEIRLSGTSNYFQGTPFSWFYQTWTKLCEDQWVDALPARLWVDWANTVLRLAFGMGYLWEVAWYEVVVRSLISGGQETTDQLKKEIGELIPWREPSAAVSVRDVAASTKWRVMRSNGVRGVVAKWHERQMGSGVLFVDAQAELDAMRADPDLAKDLAKRLSEAPETNPNLWEAINYSLLTRVGTGPNADHYGFLRKDHGPRYSLPDPGVEWLAAVASLACAGPGLSTDVGRLLANLRQLGLRPEMGDLIERLERAGVARGSADADQAVEIRAAF